MRRIVHPFNIVERVLRDRTGYFAEIARGEALPHKIADLLAVTLFGLAVFGFVAGLSGRNLVQALISTVKLPSLFLASGIICLPTLYYFSMLFGSRLRFLQTVTLVLTAQTVAAVLALGASPISLLFLISGSEPLFLVALNTSVLGLVAVLGLIFLVQGVLYVQEVPTAGQDHVLYVDLAAGQGNVPLTRVGGLDSRVWIGRHTTELHAVCSLACH